VATGRALLDRRSDTAQGDWGWSLCIRFLPSPPLITCCCPCAQAEHKPEALVKAKAHKELMLRSTVLAAPLALVPVLPDLAFRGPKGILQPIVRSPHPPRLPLVQDACCGAMRWLCEGDTLDPAGRCNRGACRTSGCRSPATAFVEAQLRPPTQPTSLPTCPAPSSATLPQLSSPRRSSGVVHSITEMPNLEDPLAFHPFG
jgi:hypothetical protein